MGVTDDHNWIQFIALQLILGPITGIAIGVAGAKLLTKAVEKNWVTEIGIGLSSLAIAVCAYTGAKLLHGNGFIAAFVAGLCFGNSFRNKSLFFYQFAETQSHLLTTFTFLLFGAVLLPSVLPVVESRHLAYAVLSLTVIRMLPVSLSLLGSGTKFSTHAFIGWFGPRGLASVLFALLILEESSIPHKEEILIVTFLTIAFSVVLHGITAAPWARLYAHKITVHRAGTEHASTKPMPYEKYKSSD